jgi:hypothetical protein
VTVTGDQLHKGLYFLRAASLHEMQPNTRSQKLSGTHYGYDSLSNLSPEEDPYAYWQVGDRTVVAPRQVSCDYCGVAPNDPLSPAREHEYVVLFANAEGFEIDRMRFKRSENPKLAVERARLPAQ